MGAFFDAALSFPAVVFSFLLLVVIGYWLLVLLGASEVDSLDGDGGDLVDDGFLSGVGLGGVPASIALSLVIAVSWFVALVATVLLDDTGLGAPITVILGLVGLLLALLVGLLSTRLLVMPLRKVFTEEPAASRADFVGLVCVVRTGSVDATFGQAEVTSADGSSAIIQVRQAAQDPLRAGSAALIYEYDTDGEFFWISPT